MKLSLKTSLGFATAVALSIGAAGSASASTLAQSTLQVTNVLFSSGGTTLDVSQFDALSFQDSTNLNPFLNGAFNPYSNSTTTGTLLYTERCVPGCPLNVPFSNATVAPTSDLARAASQLNGSPITGLPPPLGANARTEALAQLKNPGVANSSANLGLIASFSFSTTLDRTVQFDFDALVHLIAFGDSPAQTANAGVGWTLDIVDQTTGGNNVFHWAPDGSIGTGITGGTELADACNLQASRGVTLPGTASFDCSGHESAITALLFASDTYTLTISHQNRADVSLAAAVPEPATLALLGIGLVGIGFATRRKYKA